jgi:adenosylcobinamide-phosphate synthase
MLKNLLTLGLALLWDRAFGEPPSAIHPVVWIGKATELSTSGYPTGDDDRDFERGAMAGVAIPVAAALAGWSAMRVFKSFGWVAEVLGGAFLLKTTFAIRSMEQEAARVDHALGADDIESARTAVSKIVSRDVSELDASGVASTTISSVAENVNDSVIAPLLYYSVFGLPGALAYRAINTMDAMIGYHGKYEYLGRVPARLDDLAGFAPARVAGTTVVASAAIQQGFNVAGAADTMLTEHGRTESPNGGWPIGAMAGAMDVEIEKVGHYRLGPPGRKAGQRDIRRSVKLFNGAALIAGGLAAAVIVTRAARRM